MNAGELFKVNIDGQEHTKCIVQDMHAFTRKLTKSYGIVDITNGTMSAQRFSSVSSALNFIEKYWGNIETEKEEIERNSSNQHNKDFEEEVSYDL
jgi:hypothetical protein